MNPALVQEMGCSPGGADVLASFDPELRPRLLAYAITTCRAVKSPTAYCLRVILGGVNRAVTVSERDFSLCVCTGRRMCICKHIRSCESVRTSWDLL